MPNRIKYIRAPGIPKTPIGEEPEDALPAVSSNDNGKVLGVVNGVWAVKDDSGADSSPNAVLYTPQSLTPAQQGQARENIDAISKSGLAYVTPQQYGAVGDGVHDDTEAINVCFASGATNIFIPSGTYLVDAHHAGWGHETEGGLRPTSNSVITLAPDAIIKCSTSPTDFYNILHFYNVENVIVQGGKIIGDKATHVKISQPTYEFGHGIGIQNSTNIVVRDMEISDCIGDGVIFNYSGNHNVTLDNLTIHDCRRQGISLVSGDGIVISNCEIYDINGTDPQAGIDIEPDGERSVTNVVVDTCNIHDTVGASIIVTGVSNVIDQIHINGCLLDYALFLGGSNVTMDGGKSTRVCVKSDNTPIISTCSIEEIWLGGGSAVFSSCIFISSGIEKFINVLSDVVSGKAVESIVFNNCYFDVTDCTHFLYMPTNIVNKVKLIEFRDCSAKINHLVTGSYASSGFSSYMPAKMVISGSRFDFEAKIYQLFTMASDKAAALDIINSEIVNSNSYKTNYFFSGTGAYNVWIQNSVLTKYGNMLYGGDATTGEVVLLNNSFPEFSHPDGKIQADSVTITNITKDNTKYLSGVTSNVQAQLDEINNKGYLTINDLPIYNGGVS